MKIVSWNCNGALRKKLAEIDSLDADVYIVQECENPADSTAAYQDWAGDCLWIGKSKSKGLGVFPKKGNKVVAANWQGTYEVPGSSRECNAARWTSSDLQFFLPFTLNDKWSILGVWTKGSDNQVFGYIGQLWKYLQIHRDQLSGPRTLVIGDFNSNAIWDKSDRWWNHSDVVRELADLGIHSVYHAAHDERQGEETTPTFFLYRDRERPYHIDYAFASRDILEKCQLGIGQADTWLRASDHMPVQVNVRT